MRHSLKVSVKDQSDWEELLIFDKWRALIESHQVLILQGPLDIKEVRAFSIIENTPYLIFVSSSDAINGKIFSLFHELTHILLRESSLCKLGDFNEFHARKIEVFCNQVAASFLVPKDDLIGHALVQGKPRMEWEDKTLSDLSKYFKTSREVVLRRLLTLNLATKDFYEKKKAEWDRIPPKKRFGRSKDTDTRMAKTCINSNGYAVTGAILENLNNGQLSLTKASDYLSLKPKYISRLEGVFNWNA